MEEKGREMAVNDKNHAIMADNQKLCPNPEFTRTLAQHSILNDESGLPEGETLLRGLLLYFCFPSAGEKVLAQGGTAVAQEACEAQCLASYSEKKF